MAVELAAGMPLAEDGRYRLEELLGTGGMASVWLAADTRLDRMVAIKVLADSLALDGDYVARFRREARVAAGLSHPNLVNVFDVSTTGGRPYLVMEYVAGGTLADRLGEPRCPLDVEAIFRQLLSALAYVHHAGIIHRDIKPANVLIGTDGRPRLTDFGVARPSAATELTSTGLVIGTARYIAPELLKGRPATERTDLYACGVLLLDCLGESGSSRLRSLAYALTATRPELRPASAAQALSQLDRAHTMRAHRLPSAQPLRTHLPRVSRDGREIRVRLTRSFAVAAVLLLSVVAVLAALAPGGGAGRARSTSVPALHPPPAQAPLDRQLSYLQRAIAQAHR